MNDRKGGGSGPRCVECCSCASLDSAWLRTSAGFSQRLMFAESEEDCWEVFSETWPRSVMVRVTAGLSIIAYRLKPVARVTGETVSGSSGNWPTAVGDGDRKTDYAQGGKSLGAEVRRFPTPSANEDAAGTINGKMQFMLTHAAKLSEPQLTAEGGQLNADWVELIMGYPKGWTSVGDGSAECRESPPGNVTASPA